MTVSSGCEPLELAEQLEPAHPRHAHVGEDDVVARARRARAAPPRARDRAHLAAAIRQDAPRAGGASRARRRRRGRCGTSPRHSSTHPRRAPARDRRARRRPGGAAAGGTRAPRRPSRSRRSISPPSASTIRVADGEPEPGPLPRRLGREERLEDARQVGGGEPGPAVLHGDLDGASTARALTRTAPAPPIASPALRSRFRKHLREPLLVGEHAREVRGQVDRHLDVAEARLHARRAAAPRPPRPRSAHRPQPRAALGRAKSSRSRTIRSIRAVSAAMRPANSSDLRGAAGPPPSRARASSAYPAMAPSGLPDLVGDAGGEPAQRWRAARRGRSDSRASARSRVGALELVHLARRAARAPRASAPATRSNATAAPASRGRPRRLARRREQRQPSAGHPRRAARRRRGAGPPAAPPRGRGASPRARRPAAPPRQPTSASAAGRARPRRPAGAPAARTAATAAPPRRRRAGGRGGRGAWLTGTRRGRGTRAASQAGERRATPARRARGTGRRGRECPSAATQLGGGPRGSLRPRAGGSPRRPGSSRRAASRAPGLPLPSEREQPDHAPLDGREEHHRQERPEPEPRAEAAEEQDVPEPQRLLGEHLLAARKTAAPKAPNPSRARPAPTTRATAPRSSRARDGDEPDGDERPGERVRELPGVEVDEGERHEQRDEAPAPRQRRAESPCRSNARQPAAAPSRLDQRVAERDGPRQPRHRPRRSEPGDDRDVVVPGDGLAAARAARAAA